MRLRAQIIVEWAVLFTVYLMFTGGANTEELIAGALIAACAALLANVLTFGRYVRFSRLWLLSVPLILMAIVRESGILLKVLLERMQGRFEGGSFVRVELPAKSAKPGLELGRRAGMTLGVCLSPNDYIVRLEENAAIIRVLSGQELSKADKTVLGLPLL